VADGASESSFAGLWARLLTEGFVQAEADAANGWLGPLRRRWAAEVEPLELPWYAEEKREQGAFATFLGLVIRPPRESLGGRWQALAIGDSCLFQVRQDHLLAAFPVECAADFSNVPQLLRSRATGAGTKPKVEWGKWEPGDRLFLMTDALAQWFLSRHEAKANPWHSLARRLEHPDAQVVLTEYIGKLRDQKELKNDDVTVILVELAPATTAAPPAASSEGE
jgi:hypothetical protein